MAKERRCVICIFDSLTNPKPKSPVLDQEKPAFYGAELLYRSEEVGRKEFLPFLSNFCSFDGSVVLPSSYAIFATLDRTLSRREAWLILQLAMKVVKSLVNSR